MRKKTLIFYLLVVICIISCVFLFACSSKEKPDSHQISVQVSSTNLIVGQRANVEVSITNSGNNQYHCFVDNSSVVYYDENSKQLVAKGEGSTTITFVWAEDSSIKTSLQIVVSKPLSFSVTIGNNEPIQVEYGQTISAPTQPSSYQDREWVYSFDCYINQATLSEWDFSTPIIEDLVLVEKWNKTKRKYIVEIDGIESEYLYNDFIVMPTIPADYSTTTTHYIFDGWYIKDSQIKWDFETDKVDCDGIELVARYTSQTRYYTVTFVVDENVRYTAQYEYNQTLELIENPIKETDDYVYTFVEWQGIPANGKVEEDLIITAVFNQTKNYTIVKGKIVDENSNGVVALLKLDNGYECYSNEDGIFSFKVILDTKTFTLTINKDGYNVEQVQFVLSKEQTYLGVIFLSLIQYEYTVETYEEDENGEYKIIDTSKTFGVGEITITPQEKEHYIINKDKSILCGIAKEGLVLKVYYERKVYAITYCIDGNEYFIDYVKYGKASISPDIEEKDGYTAKWDKVVDFATDNTYVYAEYTLCYEKTLVNIKAKQIEFLGKFYNSFDVGADFYKDVDIRIYDSEDNKIEDFAGNGVYRIELDYNGYTYIQVVEIENGEMQVEFVLSNTLLGGRVDENQSLENSTKKYMGADEVEISDYDITFVDRQKASRYYIQSDISFISCNGKENAGLVGIMPLASSEIIDENNGAKVIVGITQEGKLAYSYKSGFTQDYVVIYNLKEKIKFDGKSYSYSLGIYRNESELYIFVNGEYITSLSFGLFNESGFGIASNVDNRQNGVVRFSAFVYSYNEELLNALDQSVETDLVKIQVITDTDYVENVDGKVYLHGENIADEIAQNVIIEINDYYGELVKIVIGAKRNFNLLLKKGRYRINVHYVGKIATTTKTLNLVVNSNTKTAVINVSLTQIGGSFNAENGIVNSYNSNYVINEGDSITISSDCYAFVNEKASAVAYIEGRFDKNTIGMYGFAMNYTDGNLIKFGAMKDEQWQDHYLNVSCEGLFSYGVDVVNFERIILDDLDYFKMGVLRIKDYYYVFINDVQIWEGQISAINQDGEIVEENNVSGFGVFGTSFCGKANRDIYNIKYTTDITVINAIFKRDFSVDTM